MLPTGTTTLARSITFAAGVALLLLAGGLARRKRRAWMLATALVAFAAAPTWPAAFDVEEAVGSATLLLAPCLRCAHRFDVAGDPDQPATSRRRHRRHRCRVGLGRALRRRACQPDRQRRPRDAARGRRILGAPPLAARPSRARPRVRRRPDPRARARPALRPRQPVVLRAAGRPPLHLLAAGNAVPGLSGRGRLRARRGRSDRCRRRDPRTSSRTSARSAASAAGGWSCCTPPPSGSTCTGAAACARSRSATRRPAPGGVLARGPGDAQGAPVGHPPAQARLRVRIVAPSSLSPAAGPRSSG